MQINIEQLLGTKVRDIDGVKVGRIEEIRVERGENALMVEAFCIGASAVIRRLSAWTLVRPIQRALASHSIYSVYEIPWRDMDLSDPKRPKLRITKAEIHRAR